MGWTEHDFTLTCEQTGTEHAVSVAPPHRYDVLDAAPLIVCLDGVWVAGAVRDATRIMSMSGESPEAIVAGLSFTDESMSSYLRSRTRWYCPTEWVPPEVTGVKGLTAEEAGKAGIYLAFVRDQVLPRLRSDYRVSELWLVGHSFSALFGLRTLFTEPELFDKYLLASPSIWWDNKYIQTVEQDYASTHDDLAARVFLSAGEQEDALGSDFNMGGNVRDMAERLRSRGYPSLGLDHAILPGDSHSSTIGAAISRGLRCLL